MIASLLCLFLFLGVSCNKLGQWSCLRCKVCTHTGYLLSLCFETSQIHTTAVVFVVIADICMQNWWLYMYFCCLCMTFFKFTQKLLWEKLAGPFTTIWAQPVLWTCKDQQGKELLVTFLCPRIRWLRRVIVLGLSLCPHTPTFPITLDLYKVEM